jgi:hypothetical protein
VALPFLFEMLERGLRRRVKKFRSAKPLSS